MNKVKIFVLLFVLVVADVLVAQNGPQYRYMRGRVRNGRIDRSLGNSRSSKSGNMYVMPVQSAVHEGVRVNAAKYNDVLKVTATGKHLVNGDVAVGKSARGVVFGNGSSVNYGRRSAENLKTVGTGMMPRLAIQSQMGDQMPVAVEGTEECFGGGEGNGPQKVRRKDDSGLETPDPEEPAPIGDAMLPLMLMVLAYVVAVRKK